MHLPDIHTILAIVSTGAFAKVALMAARSMPAPPDGASYLFRWFYDFMQQAAENQDKVGATRDKDSHGEDPSLIVVSGSTHLPEAARAEPGH